MFDALVGTLELDQGKFGGRLLAEADVANTQDEAMLERMSLRLPTADLRTQAKRQLVRRRIERSSMPEVKAHAAKVEAAVMEKGRWIQPMSSLRLQSSVETMTLPLTVMVRQHVSVQSVTLHEPGQGADELIPPIDLRPSLYFSVGWSAPLGLCKPSSAMAVEPCIDPLELKTADATLNFDDQGLVRIPEQLPMAVAMELARRGNTWAFPVQWNGQVVATFEIPVEFETPDPVIFQGEVGEHGPAVNVDVQSVPSALLFSAVSETGVRQSAIYPRGTAEFFEVVSVGGQGFTGADGRNGFDGSDGSNGSAASCPSTPGQPGANGQDGSQGGQGGSGGPGGDGGPVTVELWCGGSCPADEVLVQRLVRSQGGAGGFGGSGGRGGEGGNGGAGGSGTSCSSDGTSNRLPGGAQGSEGRDGSSGNTGDRGYDGRNGPVYLKVK